MSKDRRKLLHIHSSVYDKQPTPETLEVGELGVNNASGNTFISTKNSANEVVRFSEDETIIGWMEQKEVFPYEAYVRGADEYQVSGVTEQDLLENKSNIIIKLNQVVPENTDYSPYDEKVNGAKDIYNNPINPIKPGGYKDGAGLAIDMSQYAMQGANPSFSSITTTSHAILRNTTEINGTTEIKGSKLDTNVNGVCIKANDLNIYGTDESNFGVSCDGNNVSTKTSLNGENVLISSDSLDIDACDNISAKTDSLTIEKCTNGGSVNINTTNVNVSASTTDIKSCGKFEIKSNDIVIAQCDGDSGKILLKACDEIRIDSRNIIFSDVDCQSGQTTMESSDLCLVGEEKVNVYGKTTNVGMDCSDNVASLNTNIYGDTINESGDTINIIGEDIYVSANKLCESGETAYFYGTEKTYIGTSCDGGNTEVVEVNGETINNNSTNYNISGVTNISGETTINGDLHVTNDIYLDTDCSLSAETVNDALCEIFERSKVTVERITQPADSPLSAVYQIYQDGAPVSGYSINVPKDGFLKDVEVVESGSTYYLHFVWNVYDADEGTYSSGETYVDTQDLVTDIVANNNDLTSGAKVEVWYNEDTKKNNVSATTKLNFESTNGDFKYERKNGEHYESGTTLTFVGGSFSGGSYEPWVTSKTVNIPTAVSHLNRGKLTVKHCNDEVTFDPGSTDTSITMSHGTLKLTHNGLVDAEFDPCTSTSYTMSHSALTISYGVTCSESASGITYDTAEYKSIIVPKTISDITNGAIEYECGDECIGVKSDICMTANTIAAKAFYSKSDENAKENIQPLIQLDYGKADNVEFKCFNFKDDETKTKTYGVIAQQVRRAGLDELVHTDESGALNVDYISLLILKIANLEYKIDELTEEIQNLKNNR